MTVSYVSVGGSPLPTQRYDNPTEMEYLPFGSSQRMADNSLRVQLTGAKWRMRLFWHGLSTSERDALFAVYVAALETAAVWALPDGKSITALAALSTWSEGHWQQPSTLTWYFDVNFVIEEV